MAITITSALKNLNPVRNPVLLKATTDGHLAVAEQFAQFTATFIGGDMPVAGDSIAVQTTNAAGGWETLYTIDVVAAGTADGTKLEVNEFTGLVVDDWITDELIPVLQLDYNLNTHFDFSVASGELVGDGRTIDAPQRRLVPTGFLFSVSTDTAPTEAQLADGFGILVQLWTEDTYNGADFSLKVQEKYPVKTDGLLRLNTAEVLRSYVEPHDLDPDQTTVVTMSEQARNFYITLYEEFGDPLEQYNQTISETQPAYLAGRSEADRVAHPDWIDQLHSSIGAHQFLTCWPNTSLETAKLVRPEQREWLGYIGTDGTIEVDMVGYNVATFRLMADLYWTDGTTTTNHQLDSTAFVNFGRPYLFAVGVDQRSLASVQPSKTLDYYRVWVRAVGTGLNERLTEYRYYRVDRLAYPQWRQLHYLNSWGGWDTIALSGQRASTTQAQGVVSGRDTTEPTDLDAVRDVVVVNRTLDTVHQVGTPLLHRDELQALRDLLASERIVERVNGEHWPVQLLTDRAPTGDEAEELASFQLSYRYAFRNTANSR